MRNTGRRVADEVAQLYNHQLCGTSARPVRSRKGFERITLKPGETRTVRLTFIPADLSYWTAATRGWVQDETTFEVYAGNSSQASLKTTFEVRNR